MYVINISSTQPLNKSQADCLINASGTITLTLPPVSGIAGVTFNIKNVGTGIITINPYSTATIDGLSSISLANQYESLNITSDNTNWYRQNGIPVEG